MATRITQHIRFNVVLSAALLTALLVSALALAPRANAFIYWTEDGNVGRANLDGSNVEQSFIPGVNAAAVAVGDSKIYWTNSGSGTIGRANLDGSNGQQSFIPGVNAAAIAVDESHIYWTNSSVGTIGRANLDGTGVNQGFITGLGYPEGVAVDASHIYWASPNIGRANLDGTSVDRDIIDFPSASLAVDSSHIYYRWGMDQGSGIGRANLDGSNADPVFLRGGMASAFGGVAVDGSHIYWGNGNAIGFAKLDGISVDPDLITGIGSTSTYVSGIAVDSLASPNTTITSGPKGLTNNPSPSFAFSSDIPGSSFECRLDDDPFAPCASPKSYSDLADGSHRFRVRATSLDDQTDPSPASRKFTVDTQVDGEASAAKAQAQSGDKIVVVATVKAKENLTVRATGKVKTRRRDGCLVGRESEPKPCKVGFKLQRVDKSVGSGKKKTLKLKATDAGNRRLVKLVEKGRKAKAKLRIELTDNAGNKTTTKPKVKLKRAG